VFILFHATRPNSCPNVKSRDKKKGKGRGGGEGENRIERFADGGVETSKAGRAFSCGNKNAF